MSVRCEMSQQQTFEILEVQTREYSRYNTRGTQWKVSLNPPPISGKTPPPNPVSHFVDSENSLLDYVLEDVANAENVGIAIHKEINQNDKPIRLSFRWKYQLSSDAIWNVYDNVSQSNSRFNALDTLIAKVHSVTITVEFVRDGIKRKVTPVATIVQLKINIVEVGAKENFMRTLT